MDSSYLFEREEHRHLRTSARRFAAAEIAAHAFEWEEAGGFPADLASKASAAGLLGVGYGEELGGSGGDLTHMVVAAEELVLAGRSVGTCVGLSSHVIALPPIVRFGTADQKERFVRPVLEGRKVAALAITEPGGGSDVAAVRTRAVRKGAEYVVDGSKTFITSGCRADLVTVAVRTGGEGPAGLSLLVVERGTPGFESGPPLRKTGWWASDTAELFFDSCRVPAANLVGPENGGFPVMMANFATERLLLAGQSVAIAALAFREALAYARERMAFGRPIVGFQVTRHKLAAMQTRLACARAFVGEAIAREARGDGSPQRAAMAKNAAAEAASSVVDDAVQIHGGAGYMRESVVERLFRDARLYDIGGGTREIMNELIAKAEGY